MKEALIYLVLLVSKKDNYVYNYCYHFFANEYKYPLEDNLRCIRDKKIENVRSIEEIQNEDYTTDDEELYETRLREIKQEYKVISMELLEYYDKLKKEIPTEADMQIEILLDRLNIRKFNLDEYVQIKKEIDREIKLDNLGIK